MSQVVNFENIAPLSRFDGIPWTKFHIQESPAPPAATVWTNISNVTLSPVDLDPKVPAMRSFSTVSTLNDGLYRYYFEDAAGDLGSYSSPERLPGSVPLITLGELRAISGTAPTNTRDDDKFTVLIPIVSDMIRSYTERSFGLPIITEQRIFEYDGSGYLDIDDATSISAVTLTYPYGAADIPLTTNDWIPLPVRRADAPIYTYISLPLYIGMVMGSPEMGFTRNLDTFVRERGAWALPWRIKVDATWGWPQTPGDIKLAAVWLAQSLATRPSESGLSAEAIEGWSRTWGGRSGVSVAANYAIPAPVRDILANYARVDV